MPLEPRFRRVAALDRQFVDREGVIEAFENELGRQPAGPRVLNVTGVGGIGKTRLLRELTRRAREAGCRTAMLDLQVPAMRQHEDALAVLRTELGGQGVKFHRFDIAYAVLWQRLHPHLRLTRVDLPLASESEALSQVLDGAAGVPLFATAVGLVKLANKASGGWRRHRTTSGDETLQQLDAMLNTELVDATTYLFAEDLRGADDKRCVVFIDAYEALVPGPTRAGQLAHADVWLCDLVAQLDRGLVVIAGREPLDWTRHNPEWGGAILQCPVKGLPMPARVQLLADAGVTEERQQRAIATASAGVPFYLHLAADTNGQAQRSAAVSPEEILVRFVAHVSDTEVRLLELLSVPRIFDHGIFRLLGAEFDLPAHRMAWESLTAYSFVYPAGEDGLRLHQLMRTMLLTRLSRDVRQDVELLLRRFWRERADQRRGVAAARALREVAYHGVRSGMMSGEAVLECADRALRLGGKQVADGILTDVREYIAKPGVRTDLVAVARCLAVESAVRLGDAEQVIELASDADRSPDGVVAARLTIAAAHGQRIAGNTAAAGRIYGDVWSRHSGVLRNAAGMWMADIHMWQGRFRPAFDLARQILDECPANDLALRGDLARLLHLGYRFHLDFDAAKRGLAEARQYYQRCRSEVGLANLATNHVELLAWTQPVAAVDAAEPAVEAQQELGALHELGKTYTALAIAQLRLGRYAEAAGSFRTGCDFLDRARYRSGRARAELFRGFLLARTGATEQAVASIRWAVAEFIVAEVYPTLIVLAEQGLAAWGISDMSVSDAAERARREIEPLDSAEAFEARSLAFVADLVGERV